VAKEHYQTVIDTNSSTPLADRWVTTPDGLWAGPAAPLRDDLILGIFLDERPVRSYLYAVDVETWSCTRIGFPFGYRHIDSIDVITREMPFS